jgi:hypothetical protein
MASASGPVNVCARSGGTPDLTGQRPVPLFEASYRCNPGGRLKNHMTAASSKIKSTENNTVKNRICRWCAEGFRFLLTADNL